MSGGTATANKILEILEILNDGQWHMLEEIQQEAQLNESLTKQVIDFLKEYRLVTSNATHTRVKLRKIVQRFLARSASS